MSAATAASAAIEVESLTRRFGARRAVDDVSFALERGDCLALFGPNGAGKTTLLRVLAGLLRPTSGTARLGGVSLPGGPEVRASVGIISHHSMLYDALTARENVAFAARLYGVPTPLVSTERALARLRVLDRADSPVRALSRGLRQRVSIARAVVHEPLVVLLDEPFTGLDAVGAAALGATLRELRASGATLVLVTHNLNEGLELATHAAIMRDGRFVSNESTESLDARAFAERYREVVGA